MLGGLWPPGGSREVIEPTAANVAEFRLEMSQFFAAGNHIIATGHIRGRGIVTGKELNTAAAHVWTLRSGKVVRFESFLDTAAWLEALGIAQSEAQRLAA